MNPLTESIYPRSQSLLQAVLSDLTTLTRRDRNRVEGEASHSCARAPGFPEPLTLCAACAGVPASVYIFIYRGLKQSCEAAESEIDYRGRLISNEPRGDEASEKCIRVHADAPYI